MDAVKTANMAQEVGEGQRGARSEAQQREMEAKMMRSGLNVVWKMGKLLLEERCRRVCEIMFSKDPPRVEPLANALIQVSSPPCPLSVASLVSPAPRPTSRQGCGCTWLDRCAQTRRFPVKLSRACAGCAGCEADRASGMCGPRQMGEIFEKVGEEESRKAERKALQNGQRPQEGPNIPGL